MKPYTPDEIAAFKAADEAWQRLKERRTLQDWLTIGKAFMKGRQWAMREAGTDNIDSPHYRTAFSRFLADNRLHEIHKRDRANLLRIMEDEVEIMMWLKGLPEDEQIRLNHPAVIWRRFNATQRPKRPNLAKRLAQADQSKMLNEADEKIAALQEEIEEIGMTGDPHSSSERIIKGLQEHAGGKQEHIELVRETAELLLIWADANEELE